MLCFVLGLDLFGTERATHRTTATGRFLCSTNCSFPVSRVTQLVILTGLRLYVRVKKRSFISGNGIKKKRQTSVFHAKRRFVILLFYHH